MATTDLYQQFLRETLRRGLVDLQNDPSVTEVVGIPKPSFEIFVKIFRNGLPPEIQKNLPAHNLADKEYLRRLSFQVENILQKPAEAEKILSNMPPLANLELAYQKARERQAATLTQHQNLQTIFNQQIKQYNLDLQARLDLQLQKEFPSLAQNPEKRKILVADMAQTIQNQGLPAIKGDYRPQAQNILKEVAAKTIRQYASEIEELPTEEKINAISETIAKEETEPTSAVRREQIRAETSPTEDPTYKVGATIETSVIANLPPELAGNKELINTLVSEIEMQIHQGPQNVPQIVKNVLGRKNVQRKIAAAKIAFSTAQQQKFIDSVSEEIAPAISEISTSPQFGATPFAGSGASFAPGGGPSVSGPMAGIAAGGSGLYSTSSIPEGSIEDVFFSSGQPLHLFTALASPHSAIDFGKWLLTAGPIRSAIGFIYDSTPGASHLNYFNIGMGLIFQSQKQLETKLAKLANETGYDARRERQECRTRLSFLNEQIGHFQKIPGFEKFYNFYYGGLGRLLHPLDSLQLWAINKNIFAGLGVSGVVQTLSWTAQYGPAGFAYGIEQMPVQLGLLALKWGLSKTGLYKVVGLPGSRHYVFAPTYELGLWAKKIIYKKVLQPIKVNIGLGLRKLGRKLKIPGMVSFGRKIITGLVGKMLAALMKFLGFLGMAWGLIKALWNKVIKPAVLFLIYLILTHGAWAIGGALGGALVGLPFAAKAFALTFGFFSPFISPFLAWIPASVVAITVDVLFALGGAGVGVLLENLWSDFAANWTAAAANFSLSKAALGLSGYAFPVLITTGGLLTGGYFYMNWIIQGGFALLQFPQAQSEHILVKKDVHPFSGKLGQETIKYTLTVGPKKIGEKLINLKISDTTNSSCAGQSPAIAERNFLDKIPVNITFATPLTINYEIQTDNGFNNCLITNTATVTADVENGPTGEESFYTASVKIGNPPIQKPFGPPLKGNVCLSGYDWNEATPDGPHEGVDLCSKDKILYSTFSNESKVLHVCASASCLDPQGSGYSLTLQLGQYLVFMGHLAGPPLFKIGDRVSAEAIVGTEGHTGKALGDHVHYVIWENGRPVNPHQFGVNVPKCSCN